jgi:TonB family protein
MSTAFVWLGYCAGVGLLLALAARSAEAGARSVAREGRWVWFAAMLLTVLMPLASWMGWRNWTSDVPTLPNPLILALPAVTLEPGNGMTGPDPVRIVLYAWGFASLLLAVRLGVDFVRLRAARRGWEETVISGVRVLLTRDLGPAVFGLHRPSILFPAWALSIDEDLRWLILLHEREHVRAGDPWLLAGALLLVVLVPWNPMLWVQLHRLRLAVEMDCDARVLRRVPDPKRYGAVLLEVGRVRAGPRPMLAMSEPVTFLERRIRAFTRAAARHPVGRGLALGLVAVGLLVLAVCSRDPVGTTAVPGEPTTDLSARPVFTPYTVKPRLLNPAQVQAAIQREYPPLLRDAGVEGQTIAWFYIEASGRVTKAQVVESSGSRELDRAALKVAPLMQFSPALNRDQPVPVWVQIPITFQPRAGAEDLTQGTGALPESGVPAPVAGAGEGPRFTPYTVPPRLNNGADVQRALQERYPPLLRDAGIRGQTMVWFHIGADGRVLEVRVQGTSGHNALDQAALAVGRTMEFTPAMNRDEPVDVWVQIPITFSAQ